MPRPRILFTSWHFLLDSSNGASISAWELLRGLRQIGWDVQVLCGSALDSGGGVDLKMFLGRRGVEYKTIVPQTREVPFQIDQFFDSGINFLVFSSTPFELEPKRAIGELFLLTHRRALWKKRPDVVLTYGGFWTSPRLLAESRRYGAKTVFMLQNFAYDDAEVFNNVDLTIVPSEYSSTHYRRVLGIPSVAIPPLMKRELIIGEGVGSDSDRKHVLYVNPSLNKGVFFFAGILREASKKRPEIPFLIAEGSSTIGALRDAGIDPREFPNLFFMKNQPRPSAFYRRARIVLAPSLFQESFCRVAAEAMTAGVPVIASNRGALPETAGDAGILLGIDERFTPESRVQPTVSEVEPWLKALFKLWDDAEYREELRVKGFLRASAWEYAKILRLYDEQLKRLVSRGTREL